MKLVKGNILSPDVLNLYDAICFTSNGIVKNNGELVMGAGIAKAFRNMDNKLSLCAGIAVTSHGNKCQIVSETLQGNPVYVIAFPTKHHWRNPSDLKLIEKSSRELMKLTEQTGWSNVALTKPGCGMGQLKWEDVRAVIEPILDDRITIFYL